MKAYSIEDESRDGWTIYRLYIGDAPQARLTNKGGDIQMIWEVRGPQYWPDALVLLQGLLELSVLADQMSQAKAVK